MELSSEQSNHWLQRSRLSQMGFFTLNLEDLYRSFEWMKLRRGLNSQSTYDLISSPPAFECTANMNHTCREQARTALMCSTRGRGKLPGWLYEGTIAAKSSIFSKVLPDLPSVLRVSLYPGYDLRSTYASGLLDSTSIDAGKASKTTGMLWWGGRSGWPGKIMPKFGRTDFLIILPSLPSLLRAPLHPDYDLRPIIASGLLDSTSVDAVKSSRTTAVLWWVGVSRWLGKIKANFGRTAFLLILSKFSQVSQVSWGSPSTLTMNWGLLLLLD